MQIKKIFPVVILFAIATFAPPIATAQATVIWIVSGGQLTGANNIDLGSLGFFDVEFVEGSCASLFSGCDEPADFDFANSSDAETAANALLDQVFLDIAGGNYDTEPDLTFGCSNTTTCSVTIPYAFSGSLAFAVFAINTDSVLGDSINTNGDIIPDEDSSGMADTTFARFTPATPTTVPEPASLALFGFGLLGLGLARRRGKTA